MTIYTILAFVSIYMYGTAVNGDVLVNIGTATGPDGKVYWENYLMQFMFLIILACHIPYIFFSGKESLLIIIDESMRRSISLTLSKKLVNDHPQVTNEDPLEALGHGKDAGNKKIRESLVKSMDKVKKSIR